MHPVFVILFCVVAVFAEAAEMKPEVWGRTPEGANVEVFTLQNAHGLRARVMTWGAQLVEMSVPDRAGKLADITLGFDRLDPYLQPHPFFGSIAGRYANRIAQGKFVLDGRTFTLATNDGPNHLHGGKRGLDKRIWQADSIAANAVRFTYISPDGEEGYPGTLTATVTYTLTEADELRLDYTATTDAATVVNLTNHAYWNLDGRPDVRAHELRLAASRYTVVDERSIPTGELRAVAGTPMDFLQAKAIGRDLPAMASTPGGGFDHNWVVDPQPHEKLPLVAELYAPASGRVLRVRTDQPGIQLYTGNYLKAVGGKGGQVYEKHAGLCLETQHFPDSPNHPGFPTTVLRPGETFRSTTVHAFSVR